MEEQQSLLRTPLYEEHVALGGRMVPFAGYSMPVQYSGIIEEHKATRTSCGLFDVSHMAEFRISGQESYTFLQEMLTNDLDAIEEPGAAQYTLMLNDEGHIIDDLIVYNTGAEYLIIANASNHEKDFAWLQAHCPEGVTLVDESDRTALLALQGPRAKEIMQELCGPDWVAPKRFHIAPATLDGKIAVLVSRTGYTGEDGFELVLHEQDAIAVWRMLLSFPEVTPVGLGARDTLRLEMGYPLYGNDMDDTRDPIAAGLGWVCSKVKDGYRGSALVQAVRDNGAPEKLVYLKTEKGIPRHGYPVFAGDQQVGVIGSGSHSPNLKVGIATAYVPCSFTDPGTQLEIGVRNKRIPATVVKAPFIKK